MDNINIYPELQKPNRQGFASIIIRFDMKRSHVATGKTHQKIPPDMWDISLKRVKKKYKHALLINSVVENLLMRHKNFILKRQALGMPVTKEIIKNYINSNTAYESFYEYALKIIDTKKLKDGKGYSVDTQRRYNDEIKRVKQFKSSLSFTDINTSFLNRYKSWMQNDYKKKDGSCLNKNSIWKALGFLRMVYNEAIAEEVVLPEGNPFRQFKVGSYEQDFNKIKFLTLADVEAIEKIMPALSGAAAAIGWRFLAMCVSGMRISDAMLLDEYFFNDAGNLVFIPHKTRRNNNVATIPITTDRQRRYFEMTLSHPLKSNNAKAFRSTFNIHLKLIAAKAGININLTSHVGRHTMGSFLVDGGVEDKAAMAMLGVKSNNVIKTYLHLKQSKLHEEADKLKNVF